MDVKVTTEQSKIVSTKLRPVVKEKNLWYFTMTNNVFPHELLNISSANRGEWLYFNPFCEVLKVND